ncbi:MAG: glycosyltransferase family A protein [Bacteroidales bacterium]|nr:glycosyltransferase family A protein [Bacteroidales bacterium]MDD3431842.1 glycosyltransferase family A protein [Bacteroidales bacterium]MDD4362414.1 glycosyltransferase family A protein [Bacteroidales bacterium]MDD4431315.1 glycosyltransferase family A protein [Bacteroidales bacterium]
MDAANYTYQALNQQKLLSVVVPVFNRAPMLKTCLESIRLQNYRPLELILVDNASEDQSLQICRDYQQQYRSEDFNIVVLQETKKGACAARNKGYAASRGDYLLFFDSDDRLYPDYATVMLREAALQHYPSLLACKADIEDRNRRFVFPKRIHAQPAAQLYDPVLKTASCMIRRDLMEKCGPWDEDLQRWQDLEFGFRLLLHAPEICWILRPLFYSGLMPDSITAASYTADHLKMHQSLDKIHLSIDQQKAEDKPLLLKALAFKTISMAALLYKEQSFDLAKDYYKKGLSLCPTKSGTVLLRLHYLYTRLGGRGFWRLAEKIL